MKKITFLITVLFFLLCMWQSSVLASTNQNEWKRISVDHAQKVDGISLCIADIAVSNDKTVLYMEAKEKGKRGWGNYTRAMYIEFRIYDENGVEIPSQYQMEAFDKEFGTVEGNYAFGEWTFHSEKLFASIPTSTKSITIVPYLMLPTDGGGVELHQKGKNREIKMDYTTLKNVKFQAFQVKIPKL